MYKRPESVLVVVATQAGEVLVLRRKAPADFLQSVTGSLEWGEGSDHAARRELLEETGLHAGPALIDLHHRERFPIIPPWRSRYAPRHRENIEHWFLLLLPTRRLIRLSPAEHTHYQWLPAQRALKVLSSRTNRAAVRLVMGQVG